MYVYRYRNITWLCKLLRFFSAHLSTVSLSLGPPRRHHQLIRLCLNSPRDVFKCHGRGRGKAPKSAETNMKQEEHSKTPWTFYIKPCTGFLFSTSPRLTWRKDMSEVWSLASSANPLPVHMAQLQIFQLRENCVSKKTTRTNSLNSVSPHWEVLTVRVKAGAWSGCSLCAPAFFRYISV